MASIPRRRRHNKHNLSILSGINPQGEPTQIPASRKAFKFLTRQMRLDQTKDFAKVKKALYGIKIGDVRFVSAEELDLDNKKLEGYYSVNSKGPIRLTDVQLNQYKEIKAKAKEIRRSYQEA